MRTNPPFCHSYPRDLSPFDLFCVAQSPPEPITLFVRLSPFRPFEAVDTVGPRVGHVKKAIIVELKLEAAPHELLLFKLDGGSRTLLNSAQTLSEASITTDTELEIAIVGQGAYLRSSGHAEVCCTPFSCFYAADLSALPEPRPFILACVGDTVMYRTSVVK